MIDPMRVWQLAAAEADRLEIIEAVQRVMDEVEFVFEYLEPEWQELASPTSATPVQGEGSGIHAGHKVKVRGTVKWAVPC